jgi:hypothetical protein
MNYDYLEQRFPGRYAISIREFLGAVPVGPTLFHRLQKENKIQTVKIGARTLIPLAALKVWLDAAVAGNPGADDVAK